MDSDLRIYVDEKFRMLTERIEKLFADARTSFSTDHRAQEVKLSGGQDSTAFQLREMSRRLAQLEDDVEDLQTEIEILKRRNADGSQPALESSDRLLDERLDRLAKDIRQRFRVVNQRFAIPASESTRFESDLLGAEIEAPLHR